MRSLAASHRVAHRVSIPLLPAPGNVFRRFDGCLSRRQCDRAGKGMSTATLSITDHSSDLVVFADKPGQKEFWAGTGGWILAIPRDPSRLRSYVRAGRDIPSTADNMADARGAPSFRAQPPSTPWAGQPSRASRRALRRADRPVDNPPDPNSQQPSGGQNGLGEGPQRSGSSGAAACRLR
jgi:hypothetical protein